MNEPWQHGPAPSYGSQEGGPAQGGGWPQSEGWPAAGIWSAGAAPSAGPAGGRRELRLRWLLAGLLGITGAFVLIAAAPQIVTSIIFPDGTGRLLIVVLQALFGAAMLAVALLSAPGRQVARVVAVVIAVLAVLLTMALLAARLNGSLPATGIIGLMLTSARGWLVLSAAAAWLLASGARPVAWLSLVVTLVVAPLETFLQVQGVNYGIAEPVLQVVMLLAALVVLAASIPGTGGRRSAPPTGAVR